MLKERASLGNIHLNDVHMEGRWGWAGICHVFADSVFKQETYCSFLRMVGAWEVKKLAFFVDVING